MFKIKLIKKPHNYKNYKGLWYKLIQTENGLLKWEIQEKLDRTGHAWFFTADTPIDQWYAQVIKDLIEDKSMTFAGMTKDTFKILIRK